MEKFLDMEQRVGEQDRLEMEKTVRLYFIGMKLIKLIELSLKVIPLQRLSGCFRLQDLAFDGHVDSGLSPSGTGMLFDIGDIPDEILSEDLGRELDLDELMAVFGDVEDAPLEGLKMSPVSTEKRNDASPSTSESGNRKYCSGSDNVSRGDVVQDKAQQSSDEEEKKRQVC